MKKILVLSAFLALPVSAQVISFGDYTISYVMKMDMSPMGGAKAKLQVQQTKIGQVFVQKNILNDLNMKAGENKIKIPGEVASISMVLDSNNLSVISVDAKAGSGLAKIMPEDQMAGFINAITSSASSQTSVPLLFKPKTDYLVGDLVELPDSQKLTNDFREQCEVDGNVPVRKIMLRVDYADTKKIVATGADTIKFGKCTMKITTMTSVDPTTSAYFEAKANVEIRHETDQKKVLTLSSVLERE